ncbi:MAG: ABC transporter substrate-binding protein [Chloroflexi bacterium]|nr:ABC transporter substrate-binding protein [Chloroflexota bacterium]
MSNTSITRREFLRTLALGAGAVTVVPLLQACAAPTAPATVAPTAAVSAPAVVSPTVLRPSASFKLGSILPYTKVYAALGDSITNAMTLYFESVNFTAGGRKIEWVKEDEENDAQISLRKLTKLVEQDKIDLFTGIVSTAVLYAVRDPLHEAKMPTVISNGGGNLLTRKGTKGTAVGRYSPYIFRASFSSYQISNPLGEWIAKNVSKKVAICASNYGFGTESAADFKATFTAAGGTIAGNDILPPLGTTDFSAFLPQIQATNAEAVYSFFSGSDALNYVKQFDQFGLKKNMKIVGAGFLTESDVLPGQAASALDAYTSLHWSTELDNPENKAFMEAYAKKFPGKDVDVFAVQGYDAARVIVEALNKVQGDTSNKDKFLEAIRGVSFKSPRGNFAFDPKTQNVVNQIYFRQVKQSGSKFVNAIIGKTDQPILDPENM